MIIKKILYFLFFLFILCFNYINFCLSQEDVRQIKKENIVSEWKKEDEEKLIEIYRRGEDIGDIARVLNKSYESVKQKFEELEKSGKLKLFVENNDFKIEFVQKEICKSCPQDGYFNFNIYDKNKKISKSLKIDFAFNKNDIIYNLVLLGKKLVILSREGDSYLYAVWIVNVDTLKLEDNFWAYKLTLSPLKQFLVYVKFFPGHGELPNEVILVYDLNKSALENRLLDYEDPFSDHGIPIYPISNVVRKSYESDSIEIHYTISPFLWAKDEKKIVFFEFSESDKKNYMVVIDLKNGLDKPNIFKRVIRLEDVINMDKDKLLEDTKDFFKKNSFNFVITNIFWSDTDIDTVVVEPYPQYFLNKEYRFKIIKDEEGKFENIKDSIDMPRVEIAKKEFNFGRIREGAKVKFDIKLSNKGKADLDIKKVGVPCDCTTIIEEVNIIKPDEARSIKCEFDSTGKKGKIDYRIYIYTNDLENPKLEFKLIGEVESKGNKE